MGSTFSTNKNDNDQTEECDPSVESLASDVSIIKAEEVEQSQSTSSINDTNDQTQIQTTDHNEHDESITNRQNDLIHELTSTVTQLRHQLLHQQQQIATFASLNNNKKRVREESNLGGKKQQMIATNGGSSSNDDDDDDDEQNEEIVEEDDQSSAPKRQRTEHHTTTNNNNNNDSSSTKKKEYNHNTPIYISFSGFKNDADYYSKNLKKKIVRLLRELNLTEHVIIAADNVEDREALSLETTHIITTPFARTMKVLQAVVSHRWVMSPEWLLQLENVKKMKDMKTVHILNMLRDSQLQFGFVCSDNFLKGKSVYLMESFVQAYQDTATWKHCRVLVEFAGGQFVDSVEKADFCLTGTQSSSSSDNGEFDGVPYYCHVCTWGQFIDLIYPPYFETGLSKGKSILLSMTA